MVPQEFARGDECTTLAVQFGELSTLLVGATSEPLVQQRLVEFAVRGVPGAEHASLTEVTAGQPPRTTAQSDALPYQWDLLQYRYGQGPCLEAIATNGIVLAADLRADPRWPLLAGALVEQTPVRSMLSFRLFVSKDRRAGLNMYATRVDAFSEHAVATGAMFAAYSSVALLAAVMQKQANHLVGALETNREIGVAMGMLMAAGNLDHQQAFDQLRTASQQLNRKLHDIAADVARTGALPAAVKRRGRRKPQHRRAS